jgi:lipoprotein-anchoring transpeptidase ErfK/SrfK
MGASVTTRQRASRANPAVLTTSSPALTRSALLAGATIALLVGLTLPATALFGFGQYGDYRATYAPRYVPERPAYHRTVPSRPSTSGSFSKGRAVGKAEPNATELAARAKGKGPLRILISLDKQQLTLYAGDEVIAHSRVSSGQRGHSTPTGVFSIIQKDRWHRSNLYDDAPMYFMQRLTWSGVALHQGVVPNYPASHGCIRMPEAFARQLWTTTRMGVRVIIAHGEVAPVAIAHAKLFVPKTPAVASKPPLNSVKAAEQAWKLAQLDKKNPVTWVSVTDVPTATLPVIEEPAQPDLRALKPGPVSVFISRKAGKLFVRKGFEPVFDMPVAIEQPDMPLGTHVFTAMDAKEDSARWSVVSMTSKTSAAAALDRITIPQEAVERISALITTGASLIVSDQGLGPETGIGTDFIVVNP